MTSRPNVSETTVYGCTPSFWVEYPSGLVDLSRTGPPTPGPSEPPALQPSQLDVPVDGDRVIRINKATTAAVIIDMQNLFLHPDLIYHPSGLACVDPLLSLVPVLREQGMKILWVNWGLTDHELKTIPPALVRGFMKGGRGGFGAELPGNFGRLLMRDAYNSELYGPLQEEYLKGKKTGTDVWIHKNRISGLWGYQSELDLYLQQQGITTLLFAGVNTDQCVGGTLHDAYFRGYDCVLVSDITGTTTPNGVENMFYNVQRSYGFLTDSARIIGATKCS